MRVRDCIAYPVHGYDMALRCNTLYGFMLIQSINTPGSHEDQLNSCQFSLCETKAANPCKGERYNWPIAETLLGQNDVATRLYHRATPSKALPSCLSSGLGPTYKRSPRLLTDSSPR